MKTVFAKPGSMETVRLLSSHLPIPRASVKITPFQEGLADVPDANGRYLVDAVSRSFVVSNQLATLIQLLRGHPASYEDLTEQFNAATNNRLGPDELRSIVENSLPPDIFIEKQSKEISPFIFRAKLLRAAWLRPITRRLAWLFNVWIALPLLAVFIVTEALTLRTSASMMLQHPPFIQTLLVIVGLIASIFLHELGHLAACARGGGDHGGIGIGLYMYFPAFYSEVSQAWKLSPARRVLVDIGGVYFQTIPFIATAAYAHISGSHAAYQLCWAINFAMLHTLNPVFKFDGYWLLSDASGLTNLHRQVRQTIINGILRICGRDPRTNGNPKARVVLYIYCLLAATYFAFIIQFVCAGLIHTFSSVPITLVDAFQTGVVAIQQQHYLTVVSASCHALLACLWWVILVLASLFIIRIFANGSGSLISSWKAANHD